MVSSGKIDIWSPRWDLFKTCFNQVIVKTRLMKNKEWWMFPNRNLTLQAILKVAVLVPSSEICSRIKLEWNWAQRVATKMLNKPYGYLQLVPKYLQEDDDWKQHVKLADSGGALTESVDAWANQWRLLKVGLVEFAR